MLDVVLHGAQRDVGRHARERDAIYADPEMRARTEFLRAADLEAKYAEYGGYTAEARAGELLLGLGVPAAQHDGPMSAVAPGWKLRVLLAQALFGDPDILLLDEPTNNLDINSIRWLEDVLDQRASTMVIISHDRHFLSAVCTHMADVDYGGIRVYPGNYDDYMEASTLAKQQQQNANARAKDRIADLEDFVRRFRAHKAKARQATSRRKMIEKLKVEDVKPSSRQYPVHPLPRGSQGKAAPPGGGGERDGKNLFEKGTPLFRNLNLSIEAGEKVAIIGPNGIGKTTLLRCIAKNLDVNAGTIKWAEKARPGYWPQDPADEFKGEEKKGDESLADWLGRWRREDREHDDQIVRATLGQMLFSRRRPEEVAQGDLRRRGAAHAHRQAGARHAERDAAR